MSYVHSVLLIVDSDDIDTVTFINSQSTDRFQLNPLDANLSGGTKVPHGEVYWGGFNHLNTTEYFDRLLRAPWNRPEKLLLLVADESDAGYIPYRHTESGFIPGAY